MRFIQFLLVFLFLQSLISVVPSSAFAAPPLRIVTLNVWHGLDGDSGILTLHPYETPAQRELRYQGLVEGLRALRPDVIALQEANPLPFFAQRLAKDLGYDEIHQVANGGLKLGNWGIPVNIKEGLVILAKREWGLQRVGARRLSGPWYSIQRDWLVFQTEEVRYVLLGKIDFRGRQVYIADLHLHAGRGSSAYLAALDTLVARGTISDEDYERERSKVKGHILRRKRELAASLAFLAKVGAQPLILLGDLNASEGSEELSLLSQSGFQDVFRALHPIASGCTWDPRWNPHAKRSSTLSSVEGELLKKLTAQFEATPRRIDYIWLGPTFSSEAPLRCEVIFDLPYKGTFVSDHYGVVAEVRLALNPRLRFARVVCSMEREHGPAKN
ncbi:MAG: endonuclease/exonuclease/phosphatase family protein [Anaerolineae bacterium]|nr:endonuclease/exonuclease/phosphatase family protein [Anaerolineae bacterium]